MTQLKEKLEEQYANALKEGAQANEKRAEAEQQADTAESEKQKTAGEVPGCCLGAAVCYERCCEN